jgi:DNA-binding NarL/FixJ family response regulator
LLHAAAATRIVGVLPAIAGVKAYVELWHPDVLLIDLEVNGQNVSPFSAICSDFPGLSLVLLADHPQPDWVQRVLRSGVASVLQRDASAEQIAAAIRASAEELIILGRDAAQGFLKLAPSPQDLLANPASAERIGRLVEELTRRELEVLRMVADGLGNREIALRLGISEHTIKFHISSILGKLGASSRTEAVSQGVKRGLILL